MSNVAAIMSVSDNCTKEAWTMAVYSILERHGWTIFREVEPRWAGFNSKLRWAKKCSRELTDYTHLMLVDARDVVVLAGPDQVLEKFLEFEHPWVNATEPNIWPIGSFQESDFPEAPTSYRFLNSGLYMFEREHAEHLWWEKWPEIPQNGDDQRYLNTRYIEGYPDDIKLDHMCELFQCEAGSYGQYTMSFGKFHNNYTNTDPLVIHFNGGSRISQNKWRVLWDRHQGK